MPERVEDVRVRFSDREYVGWGDLEIVRQLDSFTTLGFAAPFDPDDAEFRGHFRPFSFRDLNVNVGDERVFTGTLIDVDPGMDPSKITVGVSAYARPGVLADVNMPPSAWPLEYNGMDLRQICERVCQPWDIGVVVDGDPGAAFERVAMEPDAAPAAFLADLARQRGFVVTDHPSGRLWLRRSATNTAPVVARFSEGKAPLVSAGVSFSARDYFSEITGLGSARAGRGGASSTVRNPHASTLRPRVYKPDDTEAGDVPTASRAQMGRMFGAAATYEIPGLPTWRAPDGRLWEPNMVVELLAPSAMVYRSTRMIVRTVTLKRTADEQSASLSCVLPGTFSGEIPEVLPWA